MGPERVERSKALSSQVLPQQDFFMYIPELQEVTRQLCRNCSDAPVQSNAGTPSTLSDWVKIALDGPMTVYAHIWNTEEEEFVA